MALYHSRTGGMSPRSRCGTSPPASCAKPTSNRRRSHEDHAVGPQKRAPSDASVIATGGKASSCGTGRAQEQRHAQTEAHEEGRERERERGRERER
jgi:hypothetical protein